MSDNLITMSARRQIILDEVKKTLAENEIEDTPIHRSLMLRGIAEVWLEDEIAPDEAFEYYLYMRAISDLMRTTLAEIEAMAPQQ